MRPEHERVAPLLTRLRAGRFLLGDWERNFVVSVASQVLVRRALSSKQTDKILQLIDRLDAVELQRGLEHLLDHCPTCGHDRRLHDYSPTIGTYCGQCRESGCVCRAYGDAPSLPIAGGVCVCGHSITAHTTRRLSGVVCEPARDRPCGCREFRALRPPPDRVTATALPRPPTGQRRIRLPEEDE